MTKRFQLTGLFTACVFFFATTGFAQEDEPALPPATDIEEAEPEAAAGQEVEINEDNYRQFMELKDPLQQRTILPENSYQSQAGLQKLDKLPEESQKHLRNQLREIIMQGDQWQPGDEDGDYPYVPSEAASTDGALQKQETEAWGELVDHYHAREGDIYANASRTSAAAAAGGSFGDGSGNGTGDGEESKEGSEGQGAAGEQAGQQGSSDQSGTEGGYSPNSASESNANSTAGVSQNAMEFLTKSGSLGANAGGDTAGSSDGNDGQQGQPAQQQAAQAQSDQQQSGQGQTAQEQSAQSQATQEQVAQEQASQGQSSQDPASEGDVSQDQVTQQADAEQVQSPENTAVQIPANETITESTAGTSQNALEYLMEKGVQTEETPGDTLTIEDLVNAQGVRVELGSGSSSSSTNDEEGPDEDTPEKDGSG